MSKSIQKILFVVLSPAYGSERFLMALRLAVQLQEQYKDGVDLKLFLMSDAVTGALAHQNPAEGYHLQEMLELLTSRGAKVKLCTTCCNSRGMVDAERAKGVELGKMSELAEWTLEADKVLNF